MSHVFQHVWSVMRRKGDWEGQEKEGVVAIKEVYVYRDTSRRGVVFYLTSVFWGLSQSFPCLPLLPIKNINWMKFDGWTCLSPSLYHCWLVFLFLAAKFSSDPTLGRVGHLLNRALEFDTFFSFSFVTCKLREKINIKKRTHNERNSSTRLSECPNLTLVLSRLGSEIKS